MRILVKFPTRSRPNQFLNILSILNEKATDTYDIQYLVTTDYDDPTMTQEVNDKAKAIIPDIIIQRGKSDNKIHACNRDLNEYSEKINWDIAILVSDDMIPQITGWDEIIRQSMTKYFPDTDGCLWFNDGYQDRVCTLIVMGKDYYNRFEYLYHPDYHSLFSDNEMTEVAKGLDKMHYSDMVLFKHEHCMNNPKVKKDKLYDRNEALYNLDSKTYERRRSEGFKS